MMSSFRRVSTGLTVAALVAAAAPPAAHAQSGSFLYVPNQNDATVSVIDMGALDVVQTVDLQALGFSANAKPHHVVVEPDGSFWYLSLIGENRVLKFDRDNRLVGQAEFEVPGMMALHPDGERLYVGRSMSAVNPPHRIGVIQRSDMSIDEIDVLYPRPHAIAVTPDGGRVYSASLAVNRIGAVDPESWNVELTDLDGPVHTMVQFAVAPDGQTLVATGQLTAKLLVFDLSDRDHPELRGTVDVGQQPWHPVYGPQGRLVYFGDKGSNTISVVDVPAMEVVRTIEGDGIQEPHGSAISPDGRYLFVSNNGPTTAERAGQEGAMTHAGYNTGTVVVVDLATDEIVKVIPVGHNAAGIGAPAR